MMKSFEVKPTKFGHIFIFIRFLTFILYGSPVFCLRIQDIFSITGVIVFVDHRFNVVELSIQPDIIRKTIKKVKKRPKDGHTVKAVCVLKR